MLDQREERIRKEVGNTLLIAFVLFAAAGLADFLGLVSFESIMDGFFKLVAIMIAIFFLIVIASGLTGRN